MKPVLLELLHCPACSSSLIPFDGKGVKCKGCGVLYQERWNQLLMTTVPDDIAPRKLSRRQPRTGTGWRIHNWDFLSANQQNLPDGSLVIDIGAGPGDFAPLFTRHRYLAVDFYPYEGLDVVCDIRDAWPFRPASADVIVCTNVLEHIYDGAGFVRKLTETLRPGGRLWIAVPFMIKIHQAPYDFHRYTHFALDKMLKEAGLQVDQLEGVYLPDNLLISALNNFRDSVKIEGPLLRVAALKGFNALAWLMPRIASRLVTSEAKGANANLNISPYPMGYHIVCVRPE